MNIRTFDMTAAVEKFWDNPVVKAVIGLAFSLLAAMILFVCSSMIKGMEAVSAKVDTVQTTIATFAKDIALTQLTVKQVDEVLRAQGSKLERVEQDSIRMTMRLEQLEREKGNRNGS